MTVLDFDPVPDRAELRARSAVQLRRAVRIGMITFAAIFVVLALALGILLDELRDTTFLAAMLGGLAVVGLLALTAVLVARREARDPSLLWGADSRTRRAVQRALRDGGAADPRTDALARETATRSLRRTWYLPLAVALALFQLILVAYALVRTEWGDALGRLAPLVAVTVIAVQRGQEVRRQRAYLRQPGPAGRPDTAA